MINVSSATWEVVTITHLAATLFLTGLIWTIQLVHYPSFSAVDPDEYQTFQQRHMSAMGILVGPPWLVEGLAVLTVFIFAPTPAALLIAIIGGLLELVVIMVTIRASIPAHEALTGGYDASAHQTLLRTNWWRTTAWTARAIVAILLMFIPA